MDSVFPDIVRGDAASAIQSRGRTGETILLRILLLLSLRFNVSASNVQPAVGVARVRYHGFHAWASTT